MSEPETARAVSGRNGNRPGTLNEAPPSHLALTHRHGFQRSGQKEATQQNWFVEPRREGGVLGRRELGGRIF